ncbi:hypothetical protein J6590_035276 [Homalodisca vitripennis]|nr:hypothetical protein J6590_035276 [Homalodisca vitripennis]
MATNSWKTKKVENIRLDRTSSYKAPPIWSFNDASFDRGHLDIKNTTIHDHFIRLSDNSILITVSAISHGPLDRCESPHLGRQTQTADVGRRTYFSQGLRSWHCLLSFRPDRSSYSSCRIPVRSGFSAGAAKSLQTPATVSGFKVGLVCRIQTLPLLSRLVRRIINAAWLEGIQTSMKLPG